MTTEAILEFESVCFDATSEQMTSVESLSFRLQSGNILMLHTDADSEHAPIVDLGLGLITPRCGSVKFMGTNWSEMDAFSEAANRGRIGCLFEKPSWISNLSVFDNIKLRERHHTQRDEKSISDEVLELTTKVGITNSTDTQLRPDFMRQRQLRVYEWVRASMGNPALIMMSFPERGTPSHALDQLISLVKLMAERGSAVVWMTDRDDILNHSDLSEWQIKIKN